MSGPEKHIICDGPTNKIGEEGHETKLANKTNKRTNWLPEHLLDDLNVQLGSHVDGVDDHHEDHDQGEEIIESPVTHDNIDSLIVAHPVIDPELQHFHTKNVTINLNSLGARDSVKNVVTNNKLFVSVQFFIQTK